MDPKPRRQHSPADKVRILRLHLLEHKPVSALCEEEGIHPTLFYQWQRAFFENGAAAFERPARSRQEPAQQRLIDSLQDKLRQKDEVIAEIAADLVREKKGRGVS